MRWRQPLHEQSADGRGWFWFVARNPQGSTLTCGVVTICNGTAIVASALRTKIRASDCPALRLLSPVVQQTG